MNQAEFDAALAKKDPYWNRLAHEAWQPWTPAERASATIESLDADVADTLLYLQEQAQGEARSVAELIQQNIPRDHMTLAEEKAFVKHWFDEYERTGFAKTFDSPYTDQKKYKGQTFEVLCRCEEDNYDLEVLPLWNIRLECGVEIEAFPEEICRLEREKGAEKPVQSAPNQIRFDSTDWNSIRDTIKKINEAGCMQLGTTEDGEDIFFDVTREGALHTTVLQKNGWERHNYYNPYRFTVDEIYRKGARESKKTPLSAIIHSASERRENVSQNPIASHSQDNKER